MEMRNPTAGCIPAAVLAVAVVFAATASISAESIPGQSRLERRAADQPALYLTGSNGSPFSTPNPYALPNATSVSDVRVGRAIVFGDSYSITKDDPYGLHSRWPFEMWNEQLVREGLFAELANYAIGGSTARSCRRRSLCAQYGNWRAQDGSFRDGDLTILYFGQNDLRQPELLSQSIAKYRSYLKQMIADGATANGKKIMVTLIPDWGKRPIGTPDDSANTVRFNSDLVNVVNGIGRRVIAVDLYTAFSRVYADPARFGLTNVTTADPAAATDTTILFYDNEHFGRKGNDITASVFRHYLTAGWDWAARVKAGLTATRRFERDLASGLVFGFPAFAPEALVQPFHFGARDAFAADMPAAEQPQTRWDLARYGRSDAVNGGTGVAFWLGPNARLSFAAGTYDEAVEIARSDSFGRTSLTAQLFGLTLEQRAFGLDWVTRVGVSQGQFVERRYHEVSDEVTSGSGDSRSLVFAQAAEAPFRLAGFGLTPWIELSFERHEVGSYRLADPLFGQVRFGGGQVDEVIAGVGLRFATPAFDFGPNTSMVLSGSVERRLGFGDTDVDLAMSEGLTSRIERVGFGRTDAWLASASAQLTMGKDMSLAIAASVSKSAEAPSDQMISARFTWRF
jgi:hypothetical protein